MKMRKLFAGLAAAATLLSGLALTAGSAAADDNVVPTSASWPTTAGTYPVTGTDLTITATDKAQLVGHVFRLYKLADYVYYQKDEQKDEGLSKETVKSEVGLQTVGWNKNYKDVTDAYKAVQAAMAEATKDNKTDGKPNDDSYATAWKGENGATETKYRSEDPLAWAAQPKKLDGTDENPNTLNSNGRIDQSPTNPWTGNTRTFAEAFKASDFATANPDTNNSAFPLAATITASDDKDATTGKIENVTNDTGQVTGYKVTVGGGAGQTPLTRGLYLIVDATDANSKVADKDWSNSLRMVVGTKLELSADGNDKLSDGTIDLKNQTMPVTKEVVKSERKGKDVVYTPNESPDYNIGDTVTYRLTTKIPSYSGYKQNAAYPYDDKDANGKNTNRRVLQITDTMSKGLTYDHVASVTVTPTGTNPKDVPLNEEQQAGPSNTPAYSANDYKITKTTKDAQDNNLTYGGTGARHDDAKDDKNNSVISSGSATKVTIDLGGYVNQATGAKSAGTNDDGSANSIAEGGTVTVIITATLNKDALVSDSTAAKANPNKVELTYSNNPDDMSQKTTVHGGEANVYTFKFQLEKYAKDSTDPENKIPLDGAEFEIATVENKVETRLVKVTTTNKTDNTSKVEWMTETKVNEMKTKNDGKLPDNVKEQNVFVSGDTNGDGKFVETGMTGADAKTGDKYANAADKAKDKKVDGYTAGLVGGLEGLQAKKYDSTKKTYTPITYKVTETKAPTGYQDTVLPSFTFTIDPKYKRDDTTNPNVNKKDQSWGVSYLTYKDDESDNNKPATVHVSYSADDKDTWSLVDQNDTKFQYDVQNVKNISQLPKTGAAGIILFGVAGLLLAAAAVTVGLKSRATKRALYA